MLLFGKAVQRLFLTVFLAFFLGSARAEDNPNELCDSLSLMAKSIMRARQSGVEMSILIDKTDANVRKAIGDIDSKKIGEVAKECIERAYDYPFVYHEDIKKELVMEFGNRIYSMCYKAQSKLRS